MTLRFWNWTPFCWRCAFVDKAQPPCIKPSTFQRVSSGSVRLHHSKALLIVFENLLRFCEGRLRLSYMILVRLRVSRETRSSSNDLDSLAHGRRCFEKLRLVCCSILSQISWGLQNVYLESISDGATAHSSFNHMETVLLRPCWLKSPSRTEAQELYEERETRMCGWYC